MIECADPVMLARRAANGEASAIINEWLSGGMARYLAGERLDVALRLDRVNRIRQRNEALLKAAELLDDGRGPWPLARRLQDAIERFEFDVWPRARLELMPDRFEQYRRNTAHGD